jgi:hypothetical protein
MFPSLWVAEFIIITKLALRVYADLPHQHLVLSLVSFFENETKPYPKISPIEILRISGRPAVPVTGTRGRV